MVKVKSGKIFWFMLFFLLLILFFLLILVYQVQAATEISACTNLNTAGETYLLTASISDSSTSYCMNISANNITLDCQSYKIDGNDVADYGIWAQRASQITTNITVQNCVVTDWDTEGIHFSKANNNTFKHLNVSSNPNDGITIRSVNYSTFTDIIVNSNGYDGICNYYSSSNIFTNITANFNGYMGFRFDSSNSSTLTNITANSNSVDGIYLAYASNSNTLTNIIVNSNERGIDSVESDSNTLTNITANSNIEYGIYLYNSNSINITNSHIENNTQYGIYLYSAGNTAPNHIYNNFFNNTVNYFFTGTVYTNNWNTTKQTGTRIFSSGTQIGGNYWANATGGYSKDCTDSDKDGFCDDPLTLNTTATSSNIDYLAYSDEYKKYVPWFYSNETFPSTPSWGDIVFLIINTTDYEGQEVNATFTFVLPNGSYAIDLNGNAFSRLNGTLISFSNNNSVWNSTRLVINKTYCISPTDDCLGTWQLNITIQDNQTTPNTNFSQMSFTITDSEKPSLTITSPANATTKNIHNITINITTIDNVEISRCWRRLNNGSNISVSSSARSCDNFTIGSLLKGNNNLTIYFNDTSSNLNFTTLTIFGDSTNPSINITIVNPEVGILNVTVHYTSSDNVEVSTIWYRVVRYDGFEEVANKTVTSSPFSFLTGTYGTFFVNVSVNDTSSNQKIVGGEAKTVSPGIPTGGGGGGGGGGAPTQPNKVKVIALIQPLEDKNIYSNLDKAIIYARILNLTETLGRKDLTGENLLTLQNMLKKDEIHIPINLLPYWIRNFKQKNIEDITVLESELEELGLVIVGEVKVEAVKLILTPPSLSPVAPICNKGIFQATVSSNKILSGVQFVRGPTNFNAKFITNNTFLITLPVEMEGATKIVEGEMTVFAKDGEAKNYLISIRFVNYCSPNFTFFGLLGLVVIVILILWRIGKLKFGRVTPKER